MQNKSYFVYVLRNYQGRIYIGFTTDLERRLGQHQKGEGRWTSDKGPWELAQFETFDNRSDAIRREKNLKRGRTNQELRKRLTGYVPKSGSFRNRKD
jgi:putative endonuclease